MVREDGHLLGSADGKSRGTWRIGAWRADLLAAILALLALAATGCGAATPAQMAPPGDSEPANGAGDPKPAQTVLTSDGTWVLESLDGQPLIENSFVMLTVNEDLATGFDGCNRYGGRTADGASVFDDHANFSAPSIGGTDIGCLEPEGILDQANAYIQALMQGRTFSVAGERLEILDYEGAVTLVFASQVPLPGDPLDLRGTEWRLLGQSDARPATMSFVDGRLVTGVTACRAYLASYQGTDGGVRFPSRSMLKYTHSCPEDARRMEGDFGDFLTWAREFAVSEEGGSRLLRMRSSRGKTLTFEPLSPTFRDIADAEWTLLALVELRDRCSEMWSAHTTRLVQGTEVTLSFDKDDLSGSSGCNTYSGQATAEDGVITIDVQTFSHTEKVCEGLDGLMVQEERFLDLLLRVGRYGTYGDGLFLQTTDQDVFLLFNAR